MDTEFTFISSSPPWEEVGRRGNCLIRPDPQGYAEDRFQWISA
jgi:hypothetical protein